MVASGDTGRTLGTLPIFLLVKLSAETYFKYWGKVENTQMSSQAPEVFTYQAQYLAESLFKSVVWGWVAGFHQDTLCKDEDYESMEG